MTPTTPEPVRPADPRDVLTRPAPPPDATVAYGSDHPDQIADLWFPRAGTPLRPLVVFVHGGFWMGEYDRGHTGPACADLAARGYTVASLEYRRVGTGGGWPSTFDDVRAGVTALPELVNQVRAGRGEGALPSGTVLVGHSAGGQLVLWAGKHVAAVTGVVALAPVADLDRAYALGLEDGAVAKVLGGTPDEVPERYAAVDPSRNVPIGVPVVVVHGELDRQVPYPFGRDWAARSQEAGDVTVLTGLADIEHFGVIDPLSPAWSAVVRGLATVCNAGRG